ncbi:unnamed protein product [Auanema sp. JU1783]|nr:unnamed protein product [Auanema sp. JU1783]
MITPTFTIEQEDDYLIITIRAPFAKIKETEIEYSEDLFVFASQPYFLRIHLPRHVIYNETGTAKYDADSGTFTVQVPKLNKGEHFPDLNMITQLLRPQETKVSAKRLVEEIGSDEEVIDEEDEYYLEQNPEEISTKLAEEQSNPCGYGFAWRRTEVLEKLKESIGNLLDGEPEFVPFIQRSSRLYEYDREHFEAGHYLADTFEPSEELTEIISSKFAADLSLNDKDLERLKDLPKRKLPKINANEQNAVLRSLIDIAFAWSYDQRINDWEESCESGWTISKLAPSLSYLMYWHNSKEAVIGSIRRSLCYPLYRNFDLSYRVLQDVKHIFSQGKTALVHVLCSVIGILYSSSEFRYLFNELLLVDLCIWLQSITEEKIKCLSDEIGSIEINKDSISLDLGLLETDAKLGNIVIEEVDSDDEAV